MPKDPAYIADHIRRVLQDGGSAPHSADVQRFFKEEVKSRGWYTAELRQLAARFRRALIREHGIKYLVEVADQLFRGEVLDEKALAIMLLEPEVAHFKEAEFRRFSLWLDRVSNWADHDGLAHSLIGPMMAARPARMTKTAAWARSPNRWLRRAAAVALIRGVRSPETRPAAFVHLKRVSLLLLSDTDDMVRKGLGWLLRESAKADPRTTVPFLVSIRGQAPRLVLRTACETLGAAERKRVLG